MKDFFKKYWTHILNLSFLGLMIAIFAVISNGIKNGNSEPPAGFFPVALLLEIILVIAILVEMFYFLIIAIKRDDSKNKGLHLLGIYMLNIFYIPCYVLTHVHKDSKAKAKNIVYVLVSVGMFIAFYLLAFQFMLAN